MNLSPEAASSVIDFLLAHQKHDAAMNLATALTETHPKAPFPWVLCSKVHYSAHRFDQAADAARFAVELAPNLGPAVLNLATILLSCGRADESEALLKPRIHFRSTLENTPAPVLLALIDALTYQGKYEEAEAITRDVLRQDPENAHFQYRLSRHLLRRGELREGMRLSIAGRKIYLWGARAMSFSSPIWEGQELKGRTICLVGEGGLGDQMICARFAKTFRERGAEVIWVCDPAIRSIFKRIEFISKAVGYEELSSLRYDYWVPALDAAGLLGLENSALPNAPYLTADPKYLKRWDQILGTDQKKLRVGIRWQGHPGSEVEQMRRVPSELMFAWKTIPGIQIFSLQVPPSPAPDEIVTLTPLLASWEDTLAALSKLDLVITNCSSLAHASGALGRPTYLIAPLMPYFTWAEPGNTTSWYPSVRVFRQKRFHFWDEPCREIGEKLAQASGSSYTSPQL